MELHRLESRSRVNELERMVDNAKRASDFLKALAHESRLIILCILAEGEKSVSELEDMLELRQPTVSQQLARLRADGLVSRGVTARRSITASPATKLASSSARSTTCSAAGRASGRRRLRRAFDLGLRVAVGGFFITCASMRNASTQASDSSGVNSGSEALLQRAQQRVADIGVVFGLHAVIQVLDRELSTAPMIFSGVCSERPRGSERRAASCAALDVAGKHVRAGWIDCEAPTEAGAFNRTPFSKTC